MRREVVSRAPTRIDLGGGWTDVPPYSDREGGFVCNVAIDRYSVVRVTGADGIFPPNAAGDAPLIRAALRRAGVSDASVTLTNDFPIGAGLGGSSAASAALLTALAEWTHRRWERAEIAEAGRRIEVEDLGIAGGRQDHYAASFGGGLALTFVKGTTAVRSISLGADVRRQLAERCLLVYTGESRISGETITAVLGAYERGEESVVVALRRMRDLAQQMAGALGRGDIDAIGELVGEHWRHQRSLHASIPTPRIDEIVAKATRAGALGAKAMGASGGGCVLVIAGPDNAPAITAVLEPLGQMLPFGIDESGVTVVSDSR